MNSTASVTAVGQGDAAFPTTQPAGPEVSRLIFFGDVQGKKEFRVADVTAAVQARIPTETTWTAPELDRPRRNAEAGLRAPPPFDLRSIVRVSGMQKWQGRIIEIDDDLFSAELIAEDGASTVVADFALSQLGNEDGVAVGDVIYVTVRSIAGRSGYPTQTSSVRLRRLGKWTNEEVAQIEERAEARMRSLDQFIE